jgi:hypothetical protein
MLIQILEVCDEEKLELATNYQGEVVQSRFGVLRVALIWVSLKQNYNISALLTLQINH